MSRRLLSPSLQTLLSRSKLRLNTALPFGGQGDRSSRAKGAGLEFAEHRPYQPGDDLRHVDPHLEARLGQTFIRQYSVDQQLPVTIVLDISASMGQGEPSKLDYAREVAAALSYLALAANDRVRLAAVTDGKAQWSPWFSGPRNADRVFAWLLTLKASGEASLAGSAKLLVPQLPKTGMVFLLSDWLAQDVGRLPTQLGGEGREVQALHVFTPDEEDPAVLAAGAALRVIDSETGEEFDVATSEQALGEYRLAWQEFTTTLREELQGQGARYLPVVTTKPVEDLLLRDWTRMGLVQR